MLTPADKRFPIRHCCCEFKVSSDPTIPLVGTCHDSKSKIVFVTSGNYVGHSGVVIKRVGTKMLNILLNPKPVTIRETSVKYISEEEYDQYSYDELANQTKQPEKIAKCQQTSSRKQYFCHCDKPMASSTPLSNTTPVSSPASLSIGASVTITGGSHPGKHGIVTKLHRKMVTIKLSIPEPDGKDTVRVFQRNVKVYNSD